MLCKGAMIRNLKVMHTLVQCWLNPLVHLASVWDLPLFSPVLDGCGG